MPLAADKEARVHCDPWHPLRDGQPEMLPEADEALFGFVLFCFAEDQKACQCCCLQDK